MVWAIFPWKAVRAEIKQIRSQILNQNAEENSIWHWTFIKQYICGHMKRGLIVKRFLGVFVWNTFKRVLKPFETCFKHVWNISQNYILKQATFWNLTIETFFYQTVSNTFQIRLLETCLIYAFNPLLYSTNGCHISK